MAFVKNNTPDPLVENTPVGETGTPSPLSPRSTWKKKLLLAGGILFGTCAIAAASVTFWYQYNLHASKFRPVQLTAAEQQAVKDKLNALGGQTAPATDPNKTIVLNEREINGYLEAQGLGETVKVHITNGHVGATLLTPVDEEVPLLGGHTVRLKIAFNTKLDERHRFALSLADVSVGGISLPNAWLGGVKGLNLLAEDPQGGARSPSLLQGFAAGIKDFQLKNGELRLVLND